MRTRKEMMSSQGRLVQSRTEQILSAQCVYRLCENSLSVSTANLRTKSRVGVNFDIEKPNINKHTHPLRENDLYPRPNKCSRM